MFVVAFESGEIAPTQNKDNRNSSKLSKLDARNFTLGMGTHNKQEAGEYFKFTNNFRNNVQLRLVSGPFIFCKNTDSQEFSDKPELTYHVSCSLSNNTDTVLSFEFDELPDPRRIIPPSPINGDCTLVVKILGPVST
jgi:hypothetical protein